MTGQRIGYLRVSSSDQNESRQLDGVSLDKTFTDKASGKDTERPQLQSMLSYAREGDIVIVHSLDRLARNLDDLRRLVGELTKKGVRVQFVKECLTFSGDDSAMSQLILSMMGAFAEFERSLIRERQREGIAAMKARGAKSGRPLKLSPDQLAEIRQLAATGVPKAQLARRFGIGRDLVRSLLPKTETQGN
jgi:DNA invertase Pin-like site-specific DNA recombinase